MNNKRLLILGGILVVALVVLIFSFKSKHHAAAQSAQAEAPSKTSSVSPTTAAAVKSLYAQATKLKNENDVLKAKEVYQQIVSNYPDADNIAVVQKDLEGINMSLIFSNTEVPGKTVLHEVVTGDNLNKIARQYGVTVDLIKRSNNIQNDVIRVGEKLRIWQGKFNIFVDKSQNILILKDGNDVVRVYNVSTGANNSTPVGTYKITTKLVDPVWFNKGMVVPPESPANVLGTRWMGFDLPGYGIHGTIDPESIGKQVTAGCVRMRKEEVEELYSLVPVGTEVVIVD